MHPSLEESDCEARCVDSNNPSLPLLSSERAAGPHSRDAPHPRFKMLALLGGVALLVTGAVFMADPASTVSNLFYHHKQPSLHSLSTPSSDSYHMASRLAAYMSSIKVLHLADGMSTDAALQDLHRWPGILVLAVAGPGKPTRRAEGQPFLSTDDYMADVLPVQSVNAAASMAEEAIGRRLFPLSMIAVDFVGLDRAAVGAVLPYAVYEVSTGRILVDASLVSGPWSAEGARQLMDSLATAFFHHAAPLLRQVRTVVTTARSSSGSPLALLLTILTPAAAAAIAGAFAVGAPPALWFCVLCPTLLGLIAPLAINLGLGQAAGEVCKALTLGDDECFDVFLGALGLGFVLSLASAIPIFFVCRLKECARGNSTLAATVGGAAWRGMRWFMKACLY